MNFFKTIIKPLYKILSILYLKKLKSHAPKNDFTIISNDCVGGVIYKRIGKKFCSPFINCYLDHCDFLKLITNLEFYMKQDIEMLENKEYPIGILGKNNNIKIHFLHYRTSEEAKECWKRRVKRIVWSRIIVIFNLTNSLDFSYVDNIAKYVESLDIKNFLILSRFKHNNVRNCKQINFRDLKTFHNAQILLPQRIPYKLHIDQINYKKCFSMFR